jgi:hypothetical protein
MDSELVMLTRTHTAFLHFLHKTLRGMTSPRRRAKTADDRVLFVF